MRVYSGKCEHGECGKESTLIDGVDNKLFVGDIVAIATIDNSGILSFHGISVVVDSRPELTGEKEHGPPFIMGLKKIDFTFANDDWYIHRVKSYKDVVSGEHWKEYGFNYR